MLRVHLITMFPDLCIPYFSTSVIGRAVEEKHVAVHYHSPLSYVEKGKRVDARPYGGGPGMVMRAEPLLQCFSDALRDAKQATVVFLTPRGEQFTQKTAQRYSLSDTLIIFCGHYEGIDERVAEATKAERVSIGPFTTTGGEGPALLIVDAVTRELPLVLGNTVSNEQLRVAGGKVYTRPEHLTFEGENYTVPPVLLSGAHNAIDTYRNETT